jgi:Na+/melibiose symporter-like transporter
MFGAMCFTALSDYFGRKPVFLFSQWALVVIGVANAFVTNYYAYVACRFVIGALQQVSIEMSKICNWRYPATPEGELKGTRFLKAELRDILGYVSKGHP